jgi:hypothetical protein
MKKIVSIFFVFILLSMLFTPDYVIAARDASLAISKTFAKVRYSDWLTGSQSTLDIFVSDVLDSTFLSVGVYAGWCIQPRITGLLHGETVTIYSSLDETNLPADLAGLPWNKINYLLNHKIRGENKSDLEYFKDVQTAVWILVGDKNPEFGVSVEAQQMVAEANAHADFVPGNGDIAAYIVYSDGMLQDERTVQEVIIEVVLKLYPTETPTLTETESPTPISSLTPTETGTTTPLPTETITATLFPTNTPTNTPSPSETVTITPSPTDTATANPPITSTSTVTPTSTLIPTPVCVPQIVVVDFSGIAPGESVEGMGKVAKGLNIEAKGMAIKIQEGVQPAVYGAGVGNVIWNGGIGAGGFSDQITQQASQPHRYTFTFEPGTSVSNFSLHMLDFGDLNPTSAMSSYASMTAYNANGFVVAKQELKFAITGYYSSPQYGNLIITGDALRAVPGQPGNWTWNVAGAGIVKVVLDFGVGFDPNIGFDTLTYITECR